MAIFSQLVTHSITQQIVTNEQHACGNDISCYIDAGFSDLFLGNFTHVVQNGTLQASPELIVRAEESLNVMIECNKQPLLVRVAQKVVLEGIWFSPQCTELDIVGARTVELTKLKFRGGFVNTHAETSSLVTVRDFDTVIIDSVNTEDMLVANNVKGGLFRIENGVNVTMRNSSFQDTTLNTNAGQTNQGGVLYVNNVTEVNIQNSVFNRTVLSVRGNTLGGVMFIGPGVGNAHLLTVTVASTIIKNNVQIDINVEGVGAYLIANTIIESCVFADNFYDNTATSSEAVGESIFSLGSLEIIDSIFVNAPGRVDIACNNTGSLTNVNKTVCGVDGFNDCGGSIRLTCDAFNSTVNCRQVFENLAINSSLTTMFCDLFQAPTTTPSTDTPTAARTIATQPPATVVPTPKITFVCSAGISCFQCGPSGCVFNETLSNEGELIITQPTIIYGDLINKGNVTIEVTDEGNGTLTVTGCVISAAEGSSIKADVSKVDSSKSPFPIINTPCFNATLRIKTDTCVSSTQERRDRAINVLTFPTDECSSSNRALIIAVTVTCCILMLMLIALGLALFFIPSFRSWLMPFNIYKADAGSGAGVAMAIN